MFFYSFAYRLKLDADVHAIELPLKYFVGTTKQLESLLDQVNNNANAQHQVVMVSNVIQTLKLNFLLSDKYLCCTGMKKLIWH